MVALASDHAGLVLKEAIKEHLNQRGVEYIDLGTNDSSSTDYPIYAKALCRGILQGEFTKGILICGTGVGMSITANRFKGIRAAACSDYFSAKATRQHNNANVLCLGERVVGAGLAQELVDVFLDTEFLGGRHQDRVDMIETE